MNEQEETQMHAQTVAGSLERSLTGRRPRTPARRPLRTAVRSRSPHAAAEWIALAIVVIAIVMTTVTFATRTLPGELDTRRVRVERGDSLWTLARANPVAGLSTEETAELIRQANGMEGSVVLAGQLIEVPDSSRLQASVARR